LEERAQKREEAMTEKRVPLLPPKRDGIERDDRFRRVIYQESAPFFENPQGVLIHRVKSLYLLEFNGGRQWYIVDYWCGNNARPREVDDGLLFDPGNKLICARCEAMAVAKGLKTSSELAGRHVCSGVCVPVNTCCPNQLN
jgi:hypothetical protein